MLKKIFAIIFVLSLLGQTCVYAATNSPYSDVKSDDWFYNPVCSLSEKGIVTGVGNGKFEPTKNVSKIEFLTMLIRASGISYSDSGAENYWGTPFLNAGYDNGIINTMDYPANEIADSMNRYEAADMAYQVLSKYFGVADKDINEVIDYIPDSIPDKYIKQVGNCYMCGVISGVDNKGTFGGNKTLTRAEAATIIYRVVNPDTRTEWTKPIVEHYGKVIGEYTTYTTDNTNRNFNINKAAQAMNGVILQPGEQFSYYKTIGNPGKEAGYKLSTVISGGKYVNGYGGGVCQNATTLFNAVLKANLQIDERRAHGLKSSYVSPGYDATFASGSIDFKFTNNYDFPIKIESFFNDDNNALTVKIYGDSDCIIPNVELKTTGSGHNWTLYRYADGVLNYTTYSTYKD